MAGNPWEKWAKISPARNYGGAGTQFLNAGTGQRFGEIDIIAREAGDVVFIEVKARAGDEFGGAAAAVTRVKQHRIGQMAIDFLARRHLLDQPCRFDVVTVDFVDGRPRVEVYTHAFTL